MISICIPIYNTEAYLRRCIDSIVNQTYTDLDIILVDDGSTDNSGRICDDYAKVDKRIRVVHKENGGESSARNTGLAHAIGEYIAFCDSDDEYFLDAIETMYKNAIEYDADFVVGGYELLGRVNISAMANKKIYLSSEASESYINDKEEYKDKYILSTVNGKLFRKSVIEKNGISFRLNYVIGNDSIFVADFVSHINKMINTFKPSYKYYLFDTDERFTGMGWYYPDMFVLAAEVEAKHISTVYGDNPPEWNVIVTYMRLLKGLSELTKYETQLQIKILDYIDYINSTIPFLIEGAVLETTKSVIIDKNRFGIPYAELAKLIVEKNYDEVNEVLRNIKIIDVPEIDIGSRPIRAMLKVKLQ